jgi:DNA repair exonuclease SbcCD ATPase subunit
MILKKITTKDFKQFAGDRVFNFEKLNIICGDNGAGKTGLAIDSIMFCLNGYSTGKLSDLPTKPTGKIAEVTTEFEAAKSIFEVARNTANKLTIIQDGVTKEYATSTVATKELEKVIGSREYFCRFRLLTNSRKYNKQIETSFLEEGKTAINKILMSLTTLNFNPIRQKLLAKKNEIEIVLKTVDTTIPFYPSTKRLEILNKGISEQNEIVSNINNEINKLRAEHLKDSNKLTEVKYKLNETTKKLENTQRYTHCYACKQPLNDIDRHKKISELTEEAKNLEETIKDLLPIEEEFKELSADYNERYETGTQRIAELKSWVTKLQLKLNQKPKQYNDRDLVLIKKAIEELDKLYALYIKNSIESLAPIINDIIGKINMRLEFTIDNKGDFDLILYVDDVAFTYGDLSEGQRLIVNLAFKMAILMERGENGLIIADEGFSSLSQDNLQYVLDIFKDSPFQLVCILHRFNDIPEGVNVINLGKEKTDEIKKEEKPKRKRKA